MGSFDEQIRKLQGDVGHRWEGTVNVDQVYAAPMERGFWVSGPLAGHTNEPRHGGETHFLANSLADHQDAYLQRAADRLLSDHGTLSAMVDNVEDLGGQVATRAPVEWGDLRESAHPAVTKDGATVFDRPAAVPRLSPGELAEKKRRTPGGDERYRRPKG